MPAENLIDDKFSGELSAIHGAVVDIRFPDHKLPVINEGIEIERQQDGPLLAEVQQHLDPTTVRAVALGNTAGLSRGAKARATGASARRAQASRGRATGSMRYLSSSGWCSAW